MGQEKHIWLGLGIAMIENGYKTKFITASELVEELIIAKEEHKLGAFEKKWLKYDVIIVDELGYVPFSKQVLSYYFSSFQVVMSAQALSLRQTLNLPNGQAYSVMRR